MAKPLLDRPVHSEASVHLWKGHIFFPLCVQKKEQLYYKNTKNT